MPAVSGKQGKHSLLDLRLQEGLFFMRMRQAIDDLPFVSASRLRALGEITPEMKTATVRVSTVGFTVALSLFRWPNGGSWSFFLCDCGRRARTIRLVEGHLRCRHWCKASGLRYRVELIRAERRAAYHMPRILARLNSDTPARLRPRPGGKLDRRRNLEFALKRSMIVSRKHLVDRAKDL
jgi:hypothetical protein